jgi:type IV pilus assembly protein PilQ
MECRRYVIPLLIIATVSAGAMTSLGASAATDSTQLRKIASRIDAQLGIVTIEASEPVPYVASQPDPTTFVIELRDIVATGFADNFKSDPRHPVSAVRVESAQAFDGSSVARVRLLLAQPIRPRVRSERNLIYVEASRLDQPLAVLGSTGPGGPSSAIRDLRVTRRGAATAITLLGSGRLTASGIEEAKDGPPRLFIDLPNATSSLPNITPVWEGPVDRVRIGLNPKAPLVTRVSMELSRRAPYRVETSQDGQDLTVIFDEPAGDLPVTRLTQAASVLSRATTIGPAVNVAPAPVAAQVAPAGPSQTPPEPGPTVAAAAQTPPTAVQAPPVQTPPATPSQVNVGTQAARYTGSPVSLDFQGADLRAVLRTFAEISGLNIVIDPTIQGTVDVGLRDVPWDQALDIILRANKLGYVVDGTIVRVAPLSVLADEETQRRRLADEQALAGELRVFTRPLSYARAEDLRPLLTATVLSPRGSVQTDPRTNTLIISDLQIRLQRAAELLTTLDVPQPQVEIEARIVQTTREFARTLGVQWGVSARANNSIGNTLPFGFPNQGSITGRTGSGQGPPAPDQQFDGANTVVDMAAANATSAIGLALGSINGAVNLDLALSALEKEGQGRLLSTPRVATQNNIEAEITQGVQIPIQTVANNTVTVTFKDAALTLKVTPQITAANTVIMRIALENASPDFSRSVNNIPPIDTQRAVTQVLVNDGDTTVIGGIYISREQASQDRTPGLSRIPLLGWLFKRDTVTDDSRELMIFITPRVIKL